MAFKAGLIIIVGIIISICGLHEASVEVYNVFDGTPLHKTSLLKIRRQHDSNTQAGSNNEKIAKIEDYPFMVMLAAGQNDMLGLGSIIGTRWILTAAHCFINTEYNITDLDQNRVRVYSNATYWMSPDSVTSRVVEIHNHPLYDMKTLKYDISVVKVDRDFTAKGEETTSYAYRGYYYRSFSSARIIGWYEVGLNQEKLYLIPQKSCKRIYHNGNHKITSKHVCAMGWGKTTCTEDSGGPLYQRGRVIGVLSSSTCDKYPVSVNVFTRISAFNGFILRTITHHD